MYRQPKVHHNAAKYQLHQQFENITSSTSTIPNRQEHVMLLSNVDSNGVINGRQRQQASSTQFCCSKNIEEGIHQQLVQLIIMSYMCIGI